MSIQWNAYRSVNFINYNKRKILIQKFKATYVRVSNPAHMFGEFVLLNNIMTEAGELFRDHAWIKYSKRWEGIRGVVEFTAKIAEYPSIDPKEKKLGLHQVRNVKRV